MKFSMVKIHEGNKGKQTLLSGKQRGREWGVHFVDVNAN